MDINKENAEIIAHEIGIAVTELVNKGMVINRDSVAAYLEFRLRRGDNIQNIDALRDAVDLVRHIHR